MQISARLSIAGQLVFVALGVTAATFFTGRAGIRSPMNLAWMLGLPIGTALVFNRGSGQRALMGSTLVALALLTTSLAGVALGIY